MHEMIDSTTMPNMQNEKIKHAHMIQFWCVEFSYQLNDG